MFRGPKRSQISINKSSTMQKGLRPSVLKSSMEFIRERLLPAEEFKKGFTEDGPLKLGHVICGIWTWGRNLGPG